MIEFGDFRSFGLRTISYDDISEEEFAFLKLLLEIKNENFLEEYIEHNRKKYIEKAKREGKVCDMRNIIEMESYLRHTVDTVLSDERLQMLLSKERKA